MDSFAEAVVTLRGGNDSAETLQEISGLLPHEGDEKYHHYIISEIYSSGDAVVRYLYPIDVPVDEDGKPIPELLAEVFNQKTCEIAANLDKSCKGKYAWNVKVR